MISGLCWRIVFPSQDQTLLLVYLPQPWSGKTRQENSCGWELAFFKWTAIAGVYKQAMQFRELSDLRSILVPWGLKMNGIDLWGPGMKYGFQSYINPWQEQNLEYRTLQKYSSSVQKEQPLTDLLSTPDAWNWLEYLKWDFFVIYKKGGDNITNTMD